MNTLPLFPAIILYIYIKTSASHFPFSLLHFFFSGEPLSGSPATSAGAPAPHFSRLSGGAEMETRRHGRRALGVINKNTVGDGAQAVNKRSISEDNYINDDRLSKPVKRPITRKFAAQLQNCQQQQQNYQMNHIPDLPIQISNSIKDCRITDEDEQIELVSEEKNQMESQEEVEMEDIFEETVIDIDRRDITNHLAVVEYVEDLYSSYRNLEASSCVSPDYMSQQSDINEKMRAILIDWLIEVHYKFELREETLFLTVNLIDRFLAKQSMVRKKLQMVGLIALLLACKYEEVSVPVIDDLIFISDKAYTRKELLEMEKLMLTKLQFNMSLPTPYVFLTRFLKAAESDKKLELLSFFLIELSLVEYEMLKFSPSLLAAATVYTAQCTLYGFKQWTKTCQCYSTYSEDQLMECSKMMVKIHQKAETEKLTGVKKKYSTSKFEYAAKKHEAALFLLEESSANLVT